MSLSQNLTGAQRLLALILILVLSGVLFSLWRNGLPAAILVSATALLLLWITKAIWLPPGYGNTAIRRLSLILLFSVAGSFGVWAPIFNSLYKSTILPFLHSRWPWIPEVEFALEPSVSLMLFILVGIFIVNFFIRERTVLSPHPEALEKEFPEKRYPERLKAFCRMLADDIKRIDIQTAWSPEYYTPLEAQVEIRSGGRVRRRITDLQSAIRSDKRSRLFLLLGDPGSGKSVALRKLAHDLLIESDRTGRVPLYINLREWSNISSCTQDNPPALRHLHEFVISNLRSRGDLFFNDFLDQYFQPMLDHGRFFLIFDSFDEVPAVLDEREGSWIVEELSRLLHNYIAGAHESRGVVASRLFRCPTSAFQATKVLEVRPFTEVRIAAALGRFPAFSEDLRRSLFRERVDLVPLARNPFLGALMGNYVQRHRVLPQNQVEIFADYVESRLLACSDRISAKNLSFARVRDVAAEVAWSMFKVERFGLEANVSELGELLTDVPLKDVIDILCYARLARRGFGEDANFSFVHRRFAEYFVASTMLKNSEPVSQEEIPSDSRWRDAMVLYAELTSDEEAREIVNFCWREILGEFDQTNLRAIHCLRFLAEAFRARKRCMSHIESNFAAFIIKQVSPYANILLAKLAVEGAGILTEEKLSKVIIRSLDMRNPWISETALKSCRHMPALSKDLEVRLRDYIASFPVQELFARRLELLFSLSLSDAFRKLHRFFKFRVVDSCSLLMGILLMVLFAPMFLVAGLSMLLLVQLMSYSSGSRARLRINVEAMVRVALSIYLFLYAGLMIWRENAVGLFSFLYVSPVFHGFMLIVIGILSIPWYLSYKFGEMLKSMGKLLPRVAFAFVIIGLLLGLTTWVSEVVIVVLASLVGITTITVMAFWLARAYIKDYLYYRRIVWSDTMERNEIILHLERLVTPALRLIFLDRLSSRRVNVIGEWPRRHVFRNDSADPVITALARLEEKWLGLER